MAGSHAARPAPGRGRRRAHDLLREILLTLAALFGAVCLVMVVLVATLDLGVIVFRTGSMSPTIPTGAAALVQSIPADQVEVGDVVTAPSPLGGELPVTHRVIATETLDDGTTRLRMRGDANDAEDPFPYDVTEVRRVIASAPGLGVALVELGDPRAMAGVTVGIAALVGWALWPRRRHDPRPRPHRGTRRVGAWALVLGLGTGTALLGWPTPATASAPAGVSAPLVALPDVAPTRGGTPPPDGFGGSAPGADGPLELWSSLPLDRRWDLSPGTDLAWRVTSTVHPPEDAAGARGTLWVSLFANGPLVERGGVALVVQMCDTGWAADGVTCPGRAREVPADVSGDGHHVDRVEVGPVASGQEQAVVVRLRVPTDLGDEHQGLGMTLALRFDAFGEEYVLGDVLAALDDEGAGSAGDALGVTGADLRPAVWGTLAALTGGVLLAWARRRRLEREGVQHGA